jgi:putative hemolysin
VAIESEESSASNQSFGGMSRFSEVLPYLQGLNLSLPKAVIERGSMQPIAQASPLEDIEAEIAALPIDQTLMSYRHFVVFFGTSSQMPATLHEITRLREMTFRAFQEGSGQPVDTDKYDVDYDHLFAWDTKQHALVGSYRLGKTDQLRERYGNDGTYLAQMFNFDEEFYAGAPLVEIGRSFVVPEYQKSHHSLFLLWCGISRYLIANPRYRQVYGVVSMSRLYDSRAMAMMRDVLLEPREDVRASAPYQADLGAPWQEFLQEAQEVRPITMRDLSLMVRALEGDERDVPVLIRHYHKLGARFHAAALDSNFNNTPGLLLRLNVPTIPPKYLKTYFGEGVQAYLDYRE